MIGKYAKPQQWLMEKVEELLERVDHQGREIERLQDEKADRRGRKYSHRPESIDA